MYVKSLHVIREFACIEDCRCARHPGSSDLRMYTTRYVTRRAELMKNNKSLCISKDGVPFPSSSGVTVKFHSSDEHVISNVRLSIPGFLADKVRYRSHICTSFKGDILSFVKVQYSSESGLFLDDGTGQVFIDDITISKYESCVRLLKNI